mmetsp:Transcript_4829/g.30684  ORF Transcript_4829/g.30684 Transcript_4829/m.30684 type:complete len:309 (+) Transcript_4829:282-1208(+)
MSRRKSHRRTSTHQRRRRAEERNERPRRTGNKRAKSDEERNEAGDLLEVRTWSRTTGPRAKYRTCTFAKPFDRHEGCENDAKVRDPHARKDTRNQTLPRTRTRLGKDVLHHAGLQRFGILARSSGRCQHAIQKLIRHRAVHETVHVNLQIRTIHLQLTVPVAVQTDLVPAPLPFLDGFLHHLEHQRHAVRSPSIRRIQSTVKHARHVSLQGGRAIQGVGGTLQILAPKHRRGLVVHVGDRIFCGEDDRTDGFWRSHPRPVFLQRAGGQEIRQGFHVPGSVRLDEIVRSLSQRLRHPIALHVHADFHRI